MSWARKLFSLRFAGFHLSLVNARVDLGEQLAFGHGIADVDVDRFELAGDLSADVNVLLGFELALGGDQGFDGCRESP